LAALANVEEAASMVRSRLPLGGASTSASADHRPVLEVDRLGVTPAVCAFSM
jgi:hypothetical protein